MLKAFGWYAKTYKVEIVDSKDHLAQLEASKACIENLLRDLLEFKYQITVKKFSWEKTNKMET